MFFLDKRIISRFDYLILFFVAILLFLSNMLISEISEMLANKQLIYFLFGLVVFAVFIFIPIRKIVRIIPFFYWLGILLLLLVDLVGVSKLGAQRWIEIPGIGLTLQPSELIKPAYYLMLGYIISKRPPPIDGYNLKDFAYISIYILIPFLLIAKEPDLGTALVMLLTGYGVLFIIGVNWKIWATIVLAVSIASPVIYTNFIKDYQKKRITDFISEEPSYHVQQSIIAIGSGGVFGKDAEDATQGQLKFLPIATSDFIFAYVVERHGFFGASLIVAIYVLLIFQILSANYYYSDDYLLRSFANGLGLLIFISMAVNILMVIGFAPVVGIPLPMFSYGGSSFLNFVILIAILQHLVAFKFQNLYSYERVIKDDFTRI